MGFVDLHIHSIYSDGSYTPERIVEEAKARNVSLLAVCDHNVVEGTLEARRIASELGVKYVPGVEIDSIFRGRDMHILCYGADLSEPDLLRRIRHARAALDGMSVELLKRMKHHYPQLSEQEYEAFQRDVSLGGWKMLEYMMKKGITKTMRDGFEFYERYGVTYDSAGFEPIEDIIRTVRCAGGKAVLAHPGVSIPFDSITEFEKEVHDIIEMGIDGIECYYPRHDRGLVQTCLRMCEAHGLMTTAGSDCHGAFNHNEIGCTHTDENRITFSL